MIEVEEKDFFIEDDLSIKDVSSNSYSVLSFFSRKRNSNLLFTLSPPPSQTLPM